MTDTCARIAAVRPRLIDGAPWWPLREICDALRVGDSGRRTASGLIDPDDKRRCVIRTGPKWWDRVSITVINAKGVERLAIRYGGSTSRRAIMAALIHGESCDK